MPKGLGECLSFPGWSGQSSATEWHVELRKALVMRAVLAHVREVIIIRWLLYSIKAQQPNIKRTLWQPHRIWQVTEYYLHLVRCSQVFQWRKYCDENPRMTVRSIGASVASYIAAVLTVHKNLWLVTGVVMFVMWHRWMNECRRRLVACFIFI